MANAMDSMPSLVFCVQYKTVVIDEEWWNSETNDHPPCNPTKCTFEGDNIWRLWSSIDPLHQLAPVDASCVSNHSRSTATVVKNPNNQKMWLWLEDLENHPPYGPIPDSVDPNDLRDRVPDTYDPLAMDWNELSFRDLQNEMDNWHCRNLWQVNNVGGLDRLDLSGPDNGFSNFLPIRYFNPSAGSVSRCHLVGHLSSLLAMVALCDGYDGSPIDRIRRLFRPNVNCPSMRIQARNSHPTSYQGIVMKIGLYIDPLIEMPITDSVRLEAWEDGRCGPLISSHELTIDEKRQQLMQRNQLVPNWR